MTAIGMIFNSIQSDSFVLVLVSQKICCLSGSTVSRFLAHLDLRYLDFLLIWIYGHLE